MRLACDTGGTFTDLIVEDDLGALRMYKTSTTPDDPVRGVIDAAQLAADDFGLGLSEFLGKAQHFIHGTTHAINAVITGRTARTAFLTTAGHRDILLLREGGRQEPFNPSIPFPEPYIPRSLTFEIDERVNAAGEVVRPLRENSVSDAISAMAAAGVEAVAVCLLWSVANPAHELRIGELLRQQSPTLPFTLSHELNPTIREFRRGSATAIDASLKPLMTSYLGSLSSRLKAHGFSGRLLVLTSQGGMLDAGDIAQTPIRAINSGPSLAPVAGRYFGRAVASDADIIVADTGGTTYDVGLVRGGRIPFTRDAWIGAPYRGHLTGFPSVDVQSVGAGGGSIAHLDAGGLLRVGPRSAGAMPGPVCYGRGGTEPTLSDACLATGYLDPDYFLGGSMTLDRDGARYAIEASIAKPMGVSIDEAAASIISLATENMVQAIADITVNQGIDPKNAILIGGGGAAGLNSIFIARRLGIKLVVIPELGPALSAAGALISELAADYRMTGFVSTAAFDAEKANAILETLVQRARSFIATAGDNVVAQEVELTVEARYEQQVWEIDVPLPITRFTSQEDVQALIDAMHEEHERIFAFRDPVAAVEVIGWSARARCRVQASAIGRVLKPPVKTGQAKQRSVYFPGSGRTLADVRHAHEMTIDERYSGPAIIESPFTTVVADPESIFWIRADGTLVLSTESRLQEEP